MKKCGVILVNYNGAADTVECVNSINKSTYKNYAIYIIDNHSDEDCTKFENLENVILIRMNENVGFGIANNIGAKKAIKDGCDLIMCLNNDTVVDTNTIQVLCDKTTGKTITTGSIFFYNERNRLWYGGGMISKIKGTFVHKAYMSDKTISFVTGCCFMVTKECYEDIGLFSDEYFMYYEDADYSIKAQQNGYSLKYFPEAKIWHKVGRSIDKSVGIKDYYLSRNRLFVLNKYSNYFLCTAWAYFYLTRAFIILVGRLQKKDMNPIIQGIRDYKKGKVGELSHEIK